MVADVWLPDYAHLEVRTSSSRGDDEPPAKRPRFFNPFEKNSRLPNSKPAYAAIIVGDEYQAWQTDREASDGDVRDPIGYWITKQSRYPRLSRMALDFLTIQPMSAECERLFSAAGKMVSGLRTNLDAEIIAICQVLRSWYRAGLIKDLDPLLKSHLESKLDAGCVTLSEDELALAESKWLLEGENSASEVDDSSQQQQIEELVSTSETALKVRLSNVLRDQILVQLPSLEQEVEEGIRDCAERLNLLGPVRGTPQQQRSYLLRVSDDYTYLMRQAVGGTYTDRFFGNRDDLAGFNKRLRAALRMRIEHFGEEMRVNGQSQYVVDSESEDEGATRIRDIPSVSRSEFIDNVANRLKYTGGRELPGLFNPLIVNELFVEQCTPWRKIAGILADDILDIVHITTEMVVEQIAAKEVSKGVLKHIRKEIDGLKTTMGAQIGALLKSAEQHPITNNPQLIQNVQQTQEDRHKRTTKALITKMFGTNRFDGSDKKISINPLELLKVAGQGFEPNMERFGSALAVDYMKAFYKARYMLQLETIDSMALTDTSVEDCLISKLPSLFTSGNVAEMSDEELNLLAGETEESSVERKRLELKQSILEKGLQDLKSLYKRSTVVGLRRDDSLTSEESEKLSAITESKSAKGSPTASSVRAASEAFSDNIPNDERTSPLRADVEWPDQGGIQDFWEHQRTATRKAVKDVMGEDHRWGG
ncbi:hypothetical protein FOBRF1_007255 [Fusarium oxysporum]